jgi:hypothetical protein
VGLARIQLAAGDLDAASRQAATVANATEGATPHVRALALGISALVSLERGETGRALGEAEEAFDLLADAGPLVEGDTWCWLAHIRALEATGRGPRAREAALRAEERVRGRASAIGHPPHSRSFLERVPENAAVIAAARRLDREPP